MVWNLKTKWSAHLKWVDHEENLIGRLTVIRPVKINKMKNIKEIIDSVLLIHNKKKHPESFLQIQGVNYLL